MLQVLSDLMGMLGRDTIPSGSFKLFIIQTSVCKEFHVFFYIKPVTDFYMLLLCEAYDVD